MTTSPLHATAPRADLRRAEFVLTGLAFLGFITLLIRVRSLPGGLPAHPLFVHVPVILIPVSVIGALAVVVRRDWLVRFGIPLCLCAIVAMSSTFLSMQAGGALSGALHLTGQAAHDIDEHSQAAKILAIGFTALTAILILSFASARIAGGRPTGLAIVDGPLSASVIQLALRVLLVVLALVCAFYVYRVGDLGAQAVWAGRLGSG